MFQAVRTTGIYCRPECSATPLPANVMPYPSAASAEAAGYRACLRCRPYRVSDATNWLDGPELVCRAVHLIVDGQLDGITEAAFASRLGVSARHLRRLFTDHVGATPGQVARSRRCHFARRLLDDSDLTITDIAFASGFGSVRQMTRAIRDVFHDTPSALRARRRNADRLVADGGLVCRLPYTPPLDWPTLLEFFAARAINGVEHVTENMYRRTIKVDGAAGVVEVCPGPPGELQATFHLPHWHGLIHHVQRVRRMFGLDVDPSAAARHFRDDPALAPWPAGLRVPGVWDPFEAGVRAILGQQVSVKGATATAGKIASALGEPVPGLGAFGLDRCFPEASAFEHAELPVPRQRAAALTTFAAACRDGDVVLDHSVPLDEFVERLCRLHGIGPWTAQYLALRLGHPDAFPATDLHVARRSQADGGGERWSPHRAAATIRLWQLS